MTRGMVWAVSACVAFSVALLTSEVQAGWNWHSASGGSYGGSWGSHGSHGSHGGWHHRHHRHHRHRRVHHGSWGSSGSWGSHGSHGSHGSRGSHGSYGSYGSAGSWGSYHSCGSSGGTVVVPAEPKVEAEKPAGKDSAYRAQSDAILTVRVPAEARVYVNGQLTTSTGEVRRYVSRGLTPGYHYTYEVRAEMPSEGTSIDETRTVQLAAGRDASLEFELDGETETTLTLNVPENAEVSLAGNEVAGEGAVRVFRTTQLRAGETWQQYTVRVSVERDGRTLTRERTIDLKAGAQTSLDFEFDAPQVADAR